MSEIKVNVWDLDVGELFSIPDNSDRPGIWRVSYDRREYMPTVGRVPIRVCVETTSKQVAKFYRGVDVIRLKAPTQETEG